MISDDDRRLDVTRTDSAKCSRQGPASESGFVEAKCSIRDITKFFFHFDTNNGIKEKQSKRSAGDGTQTWRMTAWK